MGICWESLKELMDGGVFFNEPRVPGSTGAAALVVRRIEIGAKADIVERLQIWCPARGPGGTAPKDMLFVLRGDVVGGQR